MSFWWDHYSTQIIVGAAIAGVAIIALIVFLARKKKRK